MEEHLVPASDQNVRSRISTSELIDTSANANDEAIRKLVSAYTHGRRPRHGEPQPERLPEGHRQGLHAHRRGDPGADDDAGRTSASAQQRVTDANSRMTIQTDIITNHIGALEGVDPYEASTRLSALMTQIETAYSMTARIQKLTLLNYLPI